MSPSSEDRFAVVMTVSSNQHQTGLWNGRVKLTVALGLSADPCRNSRQKLRVPRDSGRGSILDYVESTCLYQS